MLKSAIIYDGECRFCQWSVRRIRKLDRWEKFDYIPRQAEGVDEVFPILAQSDFNTGLRLIESADELHVGADAIYQIYRRLPPYHLITWAYRLPLIRPLVRFGYSLIARNRHRFGRVACDNGSCVLPSSSPADRDAGTDRQPQSAVSG